MTLPVVVQVVVDKPLAQGFDYLWDLEKLGLAPELGHIVEVPFGKSLLVGVVIKVSAHSDFEIDKLKTVSRVAPLPPIDPAALRLMNFASQYYIHALGETIIPTIPQMWKKALDWEKIPKKLVAAEEKKKKNIQESSSEGFIGESALNEEQKSALGKLRNYRSKEKEFKAILLQGQTGSGKTAVFLNWLSVILENDTSQVLLLVPEINLTPQLERRVRAGVGVGVGE